MNSYEDAQGHIHYAVEVFGKDGQGILYTTKNNNIIVRDSEVEDIGIPYTDKEAFEECKLLSIEDISGLILPTCFTKSGYILTIPDGFTTLRALYKENIKEDSSVSKFYKETGGTKKRITVLIQILRVLMKLHSIPAMYGSFSPDRILVSSDPENFEAYLLYSTGISYAMDFTGKSITDPYTAPEAVKGMGGVHSDIYAFSMMAHSLLTLQDTLAISSKEVQDLLDSVLQSDKDYYSRPRLSELYKVFLEWDNMLLNCTKCKADITYPSTECGECGALMPRLFKAEIYDKISDTKVPRGIKIFPFNTITQSLYTNHTKQLRFDETPVRVIDFVLNISQDKKLRMIFKNLQDAPINIDGNVLPKNKPILIALPKKVIEIVVPLNDVNTRHIDISIS